MDKTPVRNHVKEKLQYMGIPIEYIRTSSERDIVRSDLYASLVSLAAERNIGKQCNHKSESTYVQQINAIIKTSLETVACSVCVSKTLPNHLVHTTTPPLT